MPAKFFWRCACINRRIITWRELTLLFISWWPQWESGSISKRPRRRKNTRRLRVKAIVRARSGLGAGATLRCSLSLMILFVGVVLPFLVMALTSVLPIYASPSLELLSRLTLDNYRTVLGLDLFYQALVNNVFVGLVSATVAALLAAVVAWVVVRPESAGT